MLAAGAAPHVIATHKGAITDGSDTADVTVDRSFHTASSAEADAVVVAAGANLAEDPANAETVNQLDLLMRMLLRQAGDPLDLTKPNWGWTGPA